MGWSLTLWLLSHVSFAKHENTGYMDIDTARLWSTKQLAWWVGMVGNSIGETWRLRDREYDRRCLDSLACASGPLMRDTALRTWLERDLSGWRFHHSTSAHRSDPLPWWCHLAGSPIRRIPAAQNRTAPGPASPPAPCRVIWRPATGTRLPSDGIRRVRSAN